MTIANYAGEQGLVTVTGVDYETALAAVRVLIPENCKAIVIRTDRRA